MGLWLPHRGQALGRLVYADCHLGFRGAHLCFGLALSLAQPATLFAGHVMQGLILWLAQGFGIGRIPIMPGTFGSVVGIGWVMLLLVPHNFWVYVAGTIVGVFVSVWLCGAGEKILKQKDPSSVVMDEIIAM